MSDTRKSENDQQPQVQPMKVGEQLKAQRQARGISLVEVTEHTKIGKKYLEALEEERYELLPCAAYIQGFLRAYAKYLELDDNQLVNQYKNQHRREEEKDEGEHRDVHEKQNNQSVWMPLLALIVLAGLGAGLFLLWPAQNTNEDSVQDTVIPAQVNKEFNQLVPPAATINDILTLKIRAKEKTWITLMIDGKQEPDITLRANQEQQWQAKDRFVLWTGNAGGIEVFFNGMLQPPLGKQGEVRKEVIFERPKPLVAPTE